MVVITTMIRMLKEVLNLPLMSLAITPIKQLESGLNTQATFTLERLTSTATMQLMASSAHISTLMLTGLPTDKCATTVLSSLNFTSCSIKRTRRLD